MPSTDHIDHLLWDVGAPSAERRRVVSRARLLAAREAILLGAGLVAAKLLRAIVAEGPFPPRFDVELCLTLAEQAFNEGRLVDSAASGKQALHLATDVLKDGLLAAKPHLLIGRASAARGELDAAFAHFEDSATLFRVAGDVEGQAKLALSYGFVLLDAERAEDAEDAFQTARRLTTAKGAPVIHSRALGYLGNTARYRRRYDDAQALYHAARAIARSENDALWEAVFAMDAGLAALCQSAPHVAIEHLRVAVRSMAANTQWKPFRLSRGALDLALALAGEEDDANDDDLVAKNRVAAQDPLFTATCDLYHQGAAFVRACNRGEVNALILPPLPPSAEQHAMLVRRILGAIVAERTKALPTWTIVGVGTHVVTPDGETISLQRWPLLCRLVDALASSHANAPARPMSLQDLFAAGWPGEVALDEAMRNRVRVAISTLRRHGLRELLHSDAGGYVFAPGLFVRRSETIPEGVTGPAVSTSSDDDTPRG